MISLPDTWGWDDYDMYDHAVRTTVRVMAVPDDMEGVEGEELADRGV